MYEIRFWNITCNFMSIILFHDFIILSLIWNGLFSFNEFSIKGILGWSCTDKKNPECDFMENNINPCNLS